MSKKVIGNVLLIGFLLLLIGSVWVFNQKLNYRKMFSLDRVSLRSTNTNPSELSSVTYVINFIKANSFSVQLLPNVITLPDFSVLGRTLMVDGNDVLVFEYASNKYALKDYEKLSGSNANMYVYKNLLILNKTGNQILAQRLQDLK